MARGFLGGAIWGVVLSGVGAGAVSVAMGPVDPDRFSAVARAPVAQADEMPEQRPEPAQIPEMPAEPKVPEAADMPDVQGDNRGLAPSVEPAPAPEAEAPVADTPVAEPAIDPAKPGRRPNPETAFETPQAPGGALDAPQAPFAIGADTASPVPPTVGDVPDALAGAEPSSEAAQVNVATDAPVMPLAQSSVPGAPKPEATLDISTEPAQPPLPAVSAEETALVAEAAQKTDDALQELIPDTPAPAADPEPAPVAIAQPEAEPEADRPAIGKPAGSLLDRTQAVPASRLPRLGSGADQADASADISATPLVRFAVKPNPMPTEGQPRISIILIDDAVDTWGPEAIKTLPIPVSIAIPPSHPEAAKIAAEYRQLGFEVLAMVNIPQGAQPSDVEVTLSGTLQAVPGAVAVLEDPAGGLQSSRDVSNQAASYLADSGHGLVMMPKGLNTAQQLAAKAGVPSASLFRDMDGDNQDASAVRRALDQATFRAKQEGAVVMLGRLQANTLSGVIQWGLQDKNASIAIVPVSTVLQEAAQ